MRAVVEAAGVKDILSKCIGTSNPHNAVRATVEALSQLEAAEQVAKRRGVSLEHVTGKQDG